jgi:hypothetical protein
MTAKDEYYARKLAKEAEHRKPFTERWSIKLKDPLVWFTGLLAIATGGLVFVAEKTDNTLKDTLAATKAIQRAFVSVKQIDHTPVWDPKTKNIVGRNFVVQWENSGFTATRNMLNNGLWVEREQEIPSDFQFPDLAGMKNVIQTVAGPKATVNAGPLEIPSSVLNSIRDKGHHIYLYGWAEYNDIFDGTPRHRTEYCVEVLISSDPKAADGGVTLALCPMHNGADDEAMKKPVTRFDARPRK